MKRVLNSSWESFGFPVDARSRSKAVCSKWATSDVTSLRILRRVADFASLNKYSRSASKASQFPFRASRSTNSNGSQPSWKRQCQGLSNLGLTEPIPAYPCLSQIKPCPARVYKSTGGRVLSMKASARPHTSSPANNLMQSASCVSRPPHT